MSSIEASFINNDTINPAPNKDDEIRPDGILIPAKSSVVVGACGRENSPSGCEAAFDVAVKHSGEVTRRIYWDCPYTGRNTFRLEHPNGNWVVDFDPIPGPDGPIGSVTVRFFKVG